jgi:alpha-L-fucosidase
LPDQAYCDNFYNRSMDMINNYKPELVYFDDTALPLWPVSDAGLQFTANYYNRSMEWNNGELNAIVFGKILTEDQREAIVWDIEKGIPNEILPFNWQCCTCLGGWHYDKGLYNRDGYKPSKLVIQLLADIVSKNGNLLLSVPLPGSGAIDDKAEKIVREIGEWMSINSESIIGTRPWTLFGEGPSVTGREMRGQGFNEPGKGHYTDKDIRFTTKEDVLYAIVMDTQGETALTIHSLSTGSTHIDNRNIQKVTLLGSAISPEWNQDANGLTIAFDGSGVVVLKIEGVL